MQGDPGTKGEKGIKGDKGETGDQGAKGEMGTPGFPGDKGDRGDKGPIGEEGPIPDDINIDVHYDLDKPTEAAISGQVDRLDDIFNNTLPPPRNKPVRDGFTTTIDIRDSDVDNYSYFTKNSIPLTYYGPAGSHAKVLANNGKHAIILTGKNGRTAIFTMKAPPGRTSMFSFFSQDDNSVRELPTIPAALANVKFYDSRGNYAKIFRAENGQYVIQVVGTNGMEIIYTADNRYTYDVNKSRSFRIGIPVDGVTPVYSLSNENPLKEGFAQMAETANTITRSQMNSTSQMDVSGPMGVTGTTSNYSPDGEELYILKSQIVPPVCPRCPTVCAKKGEKCPPCPSCKRCPEPEDFECKRVPPTYSSSTKVADISPSNGSASSCTPTNDYSQYRHNKQFLPVPVVSGFDSFNPI